MRRGVVTDAHAGHRSEVARPLRRRDDLGVVGGEPTTGLVKVQPDIVAAELILKPTIELFGRRAFDVVKLLRKDETKGLLRTILW